MSQVRITPRYLKWKKELRVKIIKDLKGISLDTVKVLLLIAKDKNPVVGTDDLRKKIHLRENELGGTLRAITSIRIEGKQLVERLPFKTNRNNSLYLWDDNVAHKDDVVEAIEESLSNYGRQE